MPYRVEAAEAKAEFKKELDSDLKGNIIYKNIDDILNDVGVVDEERELMKMIVRHLEEEMYKGFMDKKCVMIPQLGNIMLNVGRIAIQKDMAAIKHKFKKEGEEQLRVLSRNIYMNAFEKKRNKEIKPKNKFKFNVDLEEKRRVTDAEFRKNYNVSKTFKFKL